MVSQRVKGITPSVICEMTALAERVGALNLAEGLPDFDPPGWLLAELNTVLSANSDVGSLHQTCAPVGLLVLRVAIAHYLHQQLNWVVNPEQQVIVTAGATEAFYLAAGALCNPDDSVVLLEPFYECYLPVLKQWGVRPQFVRLQPPHWHLDLEALERVWQAEGQRLKAVILNSPCNPTGWVWPQEEIMALVQWCQRRGVRVLSDEVYRELVYTLEPAFSPAQVAGGEESVLVLGSLSKTFSATGWRVGFAAGPAWWVQAMAVLHETVTGGTSSVHQAVAVTAFNSNPGVYTELLYPFTERKQGLLQGLEALGLSAVAPVKGAYYAWVNATVFAQHHGLPMSDLNVCQALIEHYGVVAVPGQAFFEPGHAPKGEAWLRFCFARKHSTLQQFIEKALSKQG